MDGISRTVSLKSGNQNSSLFVYHSSALWATKERTVAVAFELPGPALILVERCDFHLDSLRPCLHSPGSGTSSVPAVGVNAKCSSHNGRKRVEAESARDESPFLTLAPGEVERVPAEIHHHCFSSWRTQSQLP